MWQNNRRKKRINEIFVQIEGGKKWESWGEKFPQSDNFFFHRKKLKKKK